MSPEQVQQVEQADSLEEIRAALKDLSQEDREYLASCGIV